MPRLIALLLISPVILYCLPWYRADLDQVRSAISLQVLDRYGDLAFIQNMTVQQGSKADRAVVKAHGVKVMTVLEKNYRAEQEVHFTLAAETKSYCFEIRMECLKVEEEQVSKSISLKVAL